MSFGLSEQHLSTLLQIIAHQLTEHQHPKLWIFGSRARATHRTYSDIDLLLTDCTTITTLQMMHIKHAFEESQLPYQIDLVLEDELATEYRSKVYAEKKLIHHFT